MTGPREGGAEQAAGAEPVERGGLVGHPVPIGPGAVEDLVGGRAVEVVAGGLLGVPSVVRGVGAEFPGGAVDLGRGGPVEGRAAGRLDGGGGKRESGHRSLQSLGGSRGVGVLPALATPFSFQSGPAPDRHYMVPM